ncbi:uncharacterized protein [Acropora muricata]|uniref:uncharacterized protein n=1 Tax=Acropora muricata TaxID=159855 RepID=UPI0034E3D549
MLTLLSNLFRCTCGKCDINLVHNISKCYCCKELEGCAEALESDLVVQDLGEGATVDCITSHPGFAPVCLQKWSLRLASDRYRTSEKKIYRQTGSEDGFLRGIAYREFTRMVHGFLGIKTRIPQPACAYSSIRTVFPILEDGVFSGFEMPDIDY